MRRPTIVLAILPVLALVAAPAARAAHPTSSDARKKLQRLAHEVADGAREVYRSASGRHGHHRFWNHGHGRGQGHGRSIYAPRAGYSLRLIADLEHRARDFESALRHHPIIHTHHEFEALVRAFDRAADALYRVRISSETARDFDHLAEYMYALDGAYREAAYPRWARYRFYKGGYGGQVYGPRWNGEWRQRGWTRYDDWDSDSDSDSY